MTKNCPNQTLIFQALRYQTCGPQYYGWLFNEHIGQSVRYVNESQRASAIICNDTKNGYYEFNCIPNIRI